MFGRLGSSLFGATEFLKRLLGGSRVVACVGDPASHPGSITVSGQVGNKLYVGGLEVAVDGATFHCNDHGDQTIHAIITKTKCGGKLLITAGAVAGCGAIIRPPNRKVTAG